MARLDVTDVLLDPDFIDPLVCERIVQTVGNGGLASNVPTEVPFYGVVTNATGDTMLRNAIGERLSGAIIVHTKFRLQSGREGFSADIIRFGERRYTAMDVSDYSHFGRGFVAATCALIPLSGGDAPSS